jgi:hypothetical protein
MRLPLAATAANLFVADEFSVGEDVSLHIVETTQVLRGNLVFSGEHWRYGILLVVFLGQAVGHTPGHDLRSRGEVQH